MQKARADVDEERRREEFVARVLEGARDVLEVDLEVRKHEQADEQQALEQPGVRQQMPDPPARRAGQRNAGRATRPARGRLLRHGAPPHAAAMRRTSVSIGDGDASLSRPPRPSSRLIKPVAQLLAGAARPPVVCLGRQRLSPHAVISERSEESLPHAAATRRSPPRGPRHERAAHTVRSDSPNARADAATATKEVQRLTTDPPA